jgi:hypothetical protein
MKRTYQIAWAKTSQGRRRLVRFLAKQGQLWLLPMLELIETGQCVVDELIDVVGRAAVEAILVISAERVAGPPQQGKQKGQEGVYWYGSQPGRIALKERQLRVVKPRLRKKKRGRGDPAEVSVPAYKQYASWLQRDWPSASGSLREGLEEMYTITRLGLPGELRRCLSSTNLIDSTNSGVRLRTRRVTSWQDASMALRWAAAGFLETEKHYRRIMGYKQLWILKALLDGPVSEESIAKKRRAG